MIPFRKNQKIAIACYNEKEESFWHSELKEVGLPFVQVSNRQNKFSSIRERALVLLHPDFDQFSSTEFKQIKEVLQNGDTEIIVIVSSDSRWKKSLSAEQSIYMPDNTHPLEVARSLVEKLNLSIYLNKPQYALSFFSF